MFILGSKIVGVPIKLGAVKNDPLSESLALRINIVHYLIKLVFKEFLKSDIHLFDQCCVREPVPHLISQCIECKDRFQEMLFSIAANKALNDTKLLVKG